MLCETGFGELYVSRMSLQKPPPASQPGTSDYWSEVLDALPKRYSKPEVAAEGCGADGGEADASPGGAVQYPEQGLRARGSVIMLDFQSLNANQRRAVEWRDGPMLVLAGPGAGKTRVLTMRVARLIQETPDKRFGILALTFTTKAAEEMRSRVTQLLGPDSRRARTTTFHGFATDVLRQHGSHLGLRPDFTILNQDADRHLVLRDAMNAVGDNELPPGATGEGVLQMVDRLFRDGHDFQHGEVALLPLALSGKEWIDPIYKAYIRLLIKGNHLDFGALLVCCLRLFREHPSIARDYGVVYPFACVDEYQDTNKVQDLLLRALYPDRGANLFVVADDDQTIYQWNGASPRAFAPAPQRLRDAGRSASGELPVPVGSGQPGQQSHSTQREPVAGPGTPRFGCRCGDFPGSQDKAIRGLCD